MRYVTTTVSILILTSSLHADDKVAFQKSLASVARVACIGRDWDISLGTAVACSDGRFLVTAAHVIRSGGPVLVMLPARDEGGRVIAEPSYYEGKFASSAIPCRVIASDARRDLALLYPLKDCPIQGIPSCLKGVSPGESVFAVGNGESVCFRYSGGAVKQVYRGEFKAGGGKVEGRIILSSADLSPGDSGGPLLNQNGELVGINLAFDAETGVRMSLDFEDVLAFMRESITKIAPAGGDKP